MILDNLPAELRNEIWKLAFTLKNNWDEEADLVSACPPSKSLMLTCKQVRSEARGLYIGAYRRYWQSTRFKVTFKAGVQIDTCSLSTANLDNVRHITIYHELEYRWRGTKVKCAIQMIDPKGVWYGTSENLDWYLVASPNDSARGFGFSHFLNSASGREQALAACKTTKGVTPGMHIRWLLVMAQKNQNRYEERE